jgi:nucleoside-diphosphate-sugar epimerase
MRIVVIGGTNFIGPYVLAALHRLGHEITIYHRGHHEPELPSDIRHIHSPDAGIPVQRFPPELTDPSPDIVLHMFPVGGSDAQAAVSHFTGVAQRMVALSSGDVYLAYGRLLGSEPGALEPTPIAETAPLRKSLYPYRDRASSPAEWTYGYEKILAEQAVMSEPVLPGTVLRLPAVYGPGDPYRRLRPYIKRMEDNRPAILLESAQYRWRWSHGYVENVAQAITLAVVSDRAVGKVYNVGEAETPMTVERLQVIGELMDWHGDLVQMEADRLPAHLRAPYQPHQDLVLDTGSIRSELGFVESISVKEGLSRSIEWERSSPHSLGDPSMVEYAAEDAALG